MAPPSWIRNQRAVAVTWSPLIRTAAGATWEGSVRDSFAIHGLAGGNSAPAGRDSWEDLYAGILVNYEQARSWRRLPAARPRTRGDSFASTTHPWFRIEVASHGVYAIEGADLQAAGLADLSQIEPAKLRMFTGSGLSLPEDASLSELPAWLSEITIRLDGMDDGTFGPQDRIVFRGLGPDGWYGDFGLPESRLRPLPIGRVLRSQHLLAELGRLHGGAEALDRAVGPARSGPARNAGQRADPL